MSKLIFILLGIVFAWWVLKTYRKSMARKDAPPAAAPEDMVCCAYCGVHLPRSESRVDNDDFFCSDEHLRLHR